MLTVWWKHCSHRLCASTHQILLISKTKVCWITILKTLCLFRCLSLNKQSLHIWVYTISGVCKTFLLGLENTGSCRPTFLRKTNMQTSMHCCKFLILNITTRQHNSGFPFDSAILNAAFCTCESLPRNYMYMIPLSCIVKMAFPQSRLIHNAGISCEAILRLW